MINQETFYNSLDTYLSEIYCYMDRIDYPPIEYIKVLQENGYYTVSETEKRALIDSIEAWENDSISDVDVYNFINIITEINEVVEDLSNYDSFYCWSIKEAFNLYVLDSTGSYNLISKKDLYYKYNGMSQAEILKALFKDSVIIDSENDVFIELDNFDEILEGLLK